MKKIHTAFILVLLVMSAPAAHAFTIDGVVSDWGITPGGYGASDWTPNPGIQYALEDQNPAVDYLNPGYGGQKFDVETIYFSQDSLYAYFAVVSGFPLEGRNYAGQDYFAGDFALDFGSDGSYEFGMETTGANQGSLYKVITWADPLFTVCGPYNIVSGNYLGDAQFAYDNSTYTADGHYVFEFAINKSLFGSYWNDFSSTPQFSAKWTMSCGNDCLQLDVAHVPGVPEPSTFLLFGFGAATVMLKKRGKNKKK